MYLALNLMNGIINVFFNAMLRSNYVKMLFHVQLSMFGSLNLFRLNTVYSAGKQITKQPRLVVDLVRMGHFYEHILSIYKSIFPV